MQKCFDHRKDFKQKNAKSFVEKVPLTWRLSRLIPSVVWVDRKSFKKIASIPTVVFVILLTHSTASLRSRCF